MGKWTIAIAGQIEVMREFSGNPAPVEMNPAAAADKKTDESLDELMDELAAPG